MNLSAGKLWSLRRLADANGRFKMVAADQRPPIMSLIKQKRNVATASYDDVAWFKEILVKSLTDEASAVLLDPIWAYSRAVAHVAPTQGLLLTLEEHDFQETDGGRLSRDIDGWTVGKIRRVGADGVKVLAWYRPDASPEVCARQQEYVERIGKACAEHDICFLLELLVYPLPNEAGQTKDYIEHSAKRPELVVKSLETFADPRFGVDIFKLESPLAAVNVPELGAAGADECQHWFNELGRVANRPWVMLSAGADMDQFRRVLKYAYAAGASGYLAGRAIWLQAARAFPDGAAMEAALRKDALSYMREINELTDARARPWMAHSAFADGVAIKGAGAEFPKKYAEAGRG